MKISIKKHQRVYKVWSRSTWFYYGRGAESIKKQIKQFLWLNRQEEVLKRLKIEPIASHGSESNLSSKCCIIFTTRNKLLHINYVA